MLRIDCPSLPTSLQTHLAHRQTRNHPWNSLSRSKKDKAIKHNLAAAFHQKCGYCEQIEAETVDHFWPQEHYPNRRWDWENFILACDSCQRKKLGKQPVNAAGQVMLNPRQDEPLRYLTIDFQTGVLSALPTTAEVEARGNLTLDLLALTKRPQLNEERRRKLLDILEHIRQVIINSETSPEDSQRAWNYLRDHLSPTKPYLAVVRQLFLTENRYTLLINRLRQLYPEIDAYIQSWCLPLQPDRQLDETL